MANTLCECQVSHDEDGSRILISVYLLECISNNVADGCDLLCLPDSVHAVKSLIFDHRVPLGFHEEDMIRSCQI